MRLSSKELFQKISSNYKVTSNIKIYQILSFFTLNDVKTNLRDGQFIFDVKILNLYTSKGTYCVAYTKEIFLIHMVVVLLKNHLGSL